MTKFRPATEGEAQRGLNDTWPGDPYPISEADHTEAKRCREVADRLEAEVRDDPEFRAAVNRNKLRRAKEWREKAEALDPTPKT